MADSAGEMLEVVLGIDPVARCGRGAECRYCRAPLEDEPGVWVHLARDGTDEGEEAEEVTLACEPCAYAFVDSAMTVLGSMLELMEFDQGDSGGSGGKVVRMPLRSER